MLHFANNDSSLCSPLFQNYPFIKIWMKIERTKEFFTLFSFFLCNTSTELLVISFLSVLVINYFNNI